MIHHSGPDHVQVNIYAAPNQVLATLYGCGSIPPLPKRPAPGVPSVIFLGDAGGYQLHHLGNTVPVFRGHDQQMDMVRGHRKVQDGHIVSILGIVQQFGPPFAVRGVLEQKFTVMAPLGEMPDEAWFVVSTRMAHPSMFLVLLS
jgi:hypothetical protein